MAYTLWGPAHFQVSGINDIQRNNQVARTTAQTFNNYGSAINEHTTSIKSIQESVANSSRYLQNQINIVEQTNNKHAAKIQALETANTLQQKTQAMMVRKVEASESKQAKIEKQVASTEERVAYLQTHELPHIQGIVKQQQKSIVKEQSEIAQLRQQLAAQTEALAKSEQKREHLEDSLYEMMKGLEKQFQAFREISEAKEEESKITIELLKAKVAEQEDTIALLSAQVKKSHRLSGELILRKETSSEESSKRENFKLRKKAKILSRTTSTSTLGQHKSKKK